MLGAGALEVGGSIDTDGHGVNERNVDAHAGIERAHLLKLTLGFARRARQPGEHVDGGPAVGIDADMMELWPGVAGRQKAAEIPRAGD